MRVNSCRWAFWGILLFTLVVFLPAVRFPFVSWDDPVHLTDNRTVQSLSLDNVRTIFQSQVNQTYIPLTVLSFALEYHFFGYSPAAYHWTNLLLHLLNVSLIYLLIRALSGSCLQALVASFVFAIHPMHVESVVWVTQRKDVLYAFFYLLGMGSYYGYTQIAERTVRKALCLGGALIFGILSVLSKSMALSFPLVLLLMDSLLKRPLCLRLFMEKIPFLIAIGGIAGITYTMNMRSIVFDWPESIWLWLWCLAFYVIKFFWPMELLALYQAPNPVNLNNSDILLALLAVVMMCLLVVRWRKNPVLIFALGFYGLSIFFLLRFDTAFDLTFVSDRFMYLPSLGFCWLIGLAVYQVWKKVKNQPMAQLVLGAGIVLLGAAMVLKTLAQIAPWGNEQQLWQNVINRYPHNVIALSQLGNVALNNQNYPKAIQLYEQAIALNPHYAKPYSNLATVYLRAGRFDRAIPLYSQAIALEKTTSAVILNNRGYAYLLSQNYPEAQIDFQKALSIDPYAVDVYLNRATLYKNLGQWDLAYEDLKKVLQIDPKNLKAKNNLKILETMMHSRQELSGISRDSL